VFLLVAVLGHRLQHSVAAQSQLETELQRCVTRPRKYSAASRPA
jgi:hypothetical protein